MQTSNNEVQLVYETLSSSQEFTPRCKEKFELKHKSDFNRKMSFFDGEIIWYIQNHLS